MSEKKELIFVIIGILIFFMFALFAVEVDAWKKPVCEPSSSPSPSPPSSSPSPLPPSFSPSPRGATGAPTTERSGFHWVVVDGVPVEYPDDEYHCLVSSGSAFVEITDDRGKVLWSGECENNQSIHVPQTHDNRNIPVDHGNSRNSDSGSGEEVDLQAIQDALNDLVRQVETLKGLISNSPNTYSKSSQPICAEGLIRLKGQCVEGGKG